MSDPVFITFAILPEAFQKFSQIYFKTMGNSNDSEIDQQAVAKAAQNAANDKEVQDAMRHAANKPGL